MSAVRTPGRSRRLGLRLPMVAIAPIATGLAVAALAFALACSQQQEEGAGAESESGAAAEADPTAAEGRSLLQEGETLQEAVERVRDERPRTPQELVDGASILVQAGQAPEALWFLEEGLARFPESDRARVALARVALLVGEASRAQAVLKDVEPESEYHVQALVSRSEAHLRLGELEEALALLEEAEQRYPERREVRNARIRVLIQERRLDEAREALAEAKDSLGPDEDARNLEVLEARIQASQGDRQPAIETLTAMVEEDATYMPAWQALVQMMARERRLEELAERLEGAIEAKPDERAGLYPLLANVHQRRGEPEKAEEVIRRFVEASGSPGAYVALARFLLDEGGPQDVLDALAQAKEAHPEHPMIRMGYVEALIDVGRLDDAREGLEGLEDDLGDSPLLEYLRARVQLASGDAEGAAKRLKKLAPDLDQAETQYWLGRALQATGDLDGALRRYGLALRRDRSSVPAALAALSVSEQKGDWRGVASRGMHLMRTAPRMAEGYAAVAEAFLHLGEAEQAARVAQAFRERFPERLDAHVLRARGLRQQGKLEEAEAVLAEAREEFGDRAELVAEHGLFLGATDRVDEGVELLREAIAETPDEASLHSALAALLFQRGEAEAGAKAVDRARELAPQNAFPLRLRLQFRAAYGDLDGAIRDAEVYLSENPRDARAHFIQGTVHLRRGEKQAAIESFQRSAELDEEGVLARNNLAMLLAEQGELEQALAAAQEAYALEEENPYVLDTLGWLYLEQGLVDRSISILEEAQDATPWLPDAQYHLALAYQKAGRTAQARTLLEDLTDRLEEGGLRTEAQNALRSLP